MSFFFSDLQLALTEDLEDDVVLRGLGAKGLGQILSWRILSLANREEDGGDLEDVVEIGLT